MKGLGKWTLLQPVKLFSQSDLYLFHFGAVPHLMFKAPGDGFIIISLVIDLQLMLLLPEYF